MTRKKALEWWETMIGNTEVTHQALWPIAKSLLTRDGPRVPTGLKFHPSEKANAIADCLETEFTPADWCDKNHEWRVEARVQALLEDVDNSPRQMISQCDYRN
jgi:hypothetical protein